MFIADFSSTGTVIVTEGVASGTVEVSGAGDIVGITVIAGVEISLVTMGCAVGSIVIEGVGGTGLIDDL